MNLHIWHNESNYRKGIKDGNNLELTHGINGIRNTAKNKIQEVNGGRKDYKIDWARLPQTKKRKNISNSKSTFSLSAALFLDR